jgi:O-antigen ligase
MDSFLLNLFFLARPIMFVESNVSVAGLNLFETLTILFSVVLGAIAFGNSFGTRRQPLSLTEWAILMFVLWCTAIGLVYAQESSLKSYVKWVLPPLSYIVLKRAIRDEAQYVRCLLILIIGFIVPVAASAWLTLHGKGLGFEVYWTGLKRYEGVYNNVHTFGHNMGLVIMLLALFVTLMKSRGAIVSRRFRTLTYLWFLPLGVVALYCLYASQVRTVYIGLLVFAVVLLYQLNKKALVAFIATLAVVVISSAAIVQTVFFDVVDATKGGRAVEQAGSGRPIIWKHNLAIYSELGLDRKMAGVGIGNTVIEGGNRIGGDEISLNNVWNSHNDFLEVLMETGAVGFLLVVAIFALLLRSILRMPGQDKYGFLAFFLAVVVMNVLSNSYISRFGLAQIFFMVIVYVEVAKQAPVLSASMPSRSSPRVYFAGFVSPAARTTVDREAS